MRSDIQDADCEECRIRHSLGYCMFNSELPAEVHLQGVSRLQENESRHGAVGRHL